MIFPSENVGKNEFLIGEDVLSKRGIFKKTATIKRFEYSPLGRELKKQTDIVVKQHQGLNKVYEFDKR